MKRRMTLLTLLVVNLHLAFSATVISAYELKTEGKTNPVGIDISHPRFSWKINSNKEAVNQSAYQIVVTKTNDNEIVWNSGKIYEAKSNFIKYNGKQLDSGSKYQWKVKIWTNKGISKWSNPSQWSMAYLSIPMPEAQWIGMDSTLNSGKLTTKTHLSARYLRKEFDTETDIKSALLSISGLGMYECYINANRVSNDIFTPTLSDYTKRVYYNTYDVSSFLENRNTIAVILGNGRFFSMRMGDIPGAEALDIPAITNYGFPKLLLQLDIIYKNGQQKTIVSDKTWKINTEGAIVSNNEFDGEQYNANLEFPNWDKNGFNDALWRTAELVKAPEGKLIAQLNPNIKTMTTLKPISVVKTGGNKYLIDMGQNMVGWVNVKLNGTKNKPVIIRHAEFLNPDSTLYVANLRNSKTTDTYIPAKNGIFNWEPRFVYHGFRFVEISGINSTPTIDDIIGKVNYDYMEETGTFNSSDSTLNRIYKNAKWGIMGNYRGMPTDCPQRDERMGWLGDRATGCFGESFMFDNKLLYQKWAQDIEDSQLETGSLPDVAPTYWKFYSDNITWPAAYISTVEMLYQQFGETKTIETHYDSMKKWMNYMREKYMTDYIITKDTYGDWCMPPEDLKLIHSADPNRKTNGELLSTSFYFRLLNTMANFAEIQKKTQDAAEFRLLAEKVKNAYNKKFFKQGTAQYDNNTVTANLISLMQGLVPQDFEQAVFQNICKTIENDYNSHVSVGLIGIQFLMKGLTKYGRADLALKIATNKTYPSWGYMIDNGATTIWELWNGNTADPAMNSGNHVMLLGDLLRWYYEDLAGIKTDKTEVGFKKILMKPTFPANLNFINASHTSIYGKILSHWSKGTNSLNWEIEIPANSSATVTLPTNSIENILNFDKKIAKYKSIKVLKSTNNQIEIEVLSGKYQFRISNTIY